MVKSLIASRVFLLLDIDLKLSSKQWIYANTYVLLKAILLEIIFCFGLTFGFGLGLIMSTTFHPYYIINTIFIYFGSVAISTQFIAFNNLVNLGPSSTYAYQLSLP